MKIRKSESTLRFILITEFEINIIFLFEVFKNYYFIKQNLLSAFQSFNEICPIVLKVKMYWKIAITLFNSWKFTKNWILHEKK